MGEMRTREIKFRGWSDTLGMSDSITIDFLIKNQTDFREFKVIEQFTGLYDKNRKEIYEGDCLGGSLENTHVAWCDTCHQFQLIISDMNECLSCSGDYSWAEFVDGSEDYEVIGNIHTDSHLLAVN